MLNPKGRLKTYYLDNFEAHYHRHQRQTIQIKLIVTKSPIWKNWFISLRIILIFHAAYFISRYQLKQIKNNDKPKQITRLSWLVLIFKPYSFELSDEVKRRKERRNGKWHLWFCLLGWPSWRWIASELIDF